jgi:hypothetical protein
VKALLWHLAPADENKGWHPDPELEKGKGKDLLCIFMISGETTFHV